MKVISDTNILVSAAIRDGIPELTFPEIEFTTRLMVKVLDIKSFREIKRNDPDKNYNNLDFNVSLLIYLLNAFSSDKDYTRRSESVKKYIQKLRDEEDYEKRREQAIHEEETKTKAAWETDPYYW